MHAARGVDLERPGAAADGPGAPIIDVECAE